MNGSDNEANTGDDPEPIRFESVSDLANWCKSADADDLDQHSLRHVRQEAGRLGIRVRLPEMPLKSVMAARWIDPPDVEILDQWGRIVFDFVGAIEAAIACVVPPTDPVRESLTGKIVPKLYDILSETSKSVSFDSLYCCWDDVPTDSAIVGRLKSLKGRLLTHGQTVSISKKHRTAKIEKKIWK